MDQLLDYWDKQEQNSDTGCDPCSVQTSLLQFFVALK